MATGRRSRVRRVVAAIVVLAALSAVLVVGVDSARDRLLESDPSRTVVVLQEGATSTDASPRTWTVEVAPDQTLIVDAVSVELVREDEGSRIDNRNADGILLVAEGGHPYTLTLEEGRWAVVAEGDARQEYCNRQRGRDGEWGVEYRPASWPSDPC